MNTKIRTYARVFPSAGIDIVPSSQFEILDGNTFLQKQSDKKLAMYPFTCIFAQQFDYQRIVEHMNIVNDTFEGVNQIIIAEINKQNLNNFLLGTVDEPGIILTLFQQMFNEAVYHGLGDQQEHKRTQKCIKREQHISISIFSTEGTSNKFTDLILGQKLTFYSKKDMDEFKNFYDKEIQQIREFLIALKIGMTRFGEFYQDGDPIVFRISVNSYDQIKNQEYQTVLHLIVAETRSPIIKQICKKIDMHLQSVQTKGEDHGSLANYFEKQLKHGRCKVSYIYGLPFRKKELLKSLQTFVFLTKIRGQCPFVKLSPQFPSLIKFNFNDIQQHLTTTAYEKYVVSPSSNFTHKQLNIIAKMLQKLMEFMNQSSYKWKQYCAMMDQILFSQENFYNRERVPISLEIKDQNIKAFLISKVYKLSENYQIEDHSNVMQKLRVLKNQIFISLKVLFTSVQSSKNQGGSKSYQHFLAYFLNILSSISESLHKILSICFRHLTYFRVEKLSEQIDVETLFDSKFVKEIIETIRREAKRVKDNFSKDQVLIRKIQIPLHDSQTEGMEFEDSKKGQRNMFSLSRVQKQNKNPYGDLSLSMSFQMFQHSKRNIKSKYGQKQNKITYKYMHSMAKNSLDQLQNSQVLSNSISKSQTKKYQSFSQPKIAVIHRKKK